MEIPDLDLEVLTSLSLGQYIKASVWDFPVMTSLSVNKWYVNRKTNKGITLFTVYFQKHRPKIVHFAETQRKIITIQYEILLWIFDEYFPHSSLNQGNPRQTYNAFTRVFVGR